ncbi:MAG: DUF3006 domain-containing protein [Patescibacteria group bacterium]|jgi:hypothetical protein
MTVPASAYHTTVTIRRFEGTQAVLETADSQMLRWPIKNLPEDIVEGAELQLAVRTEVTDRAEHQTMMRELLNSLLQS